MHDPPELGQLVASLRHERSVAQDLIDKGTTWGGFLAGLKAERKRRVNRENGQ